MRPEMFEIETQKTDLETSLEIPSLKILLCKFSTEFGNT